jgi:UPF0755 protein
MPLQLDSTVRYIAPSESPFVSSEDIAIDSPYNTYKYVGLPPGPIAMPSSASVEAAIHPAQTTYQYFVTVNLSTGETRYATTFQQHQDNVALLQQWYEANDN